MKHWILAAATVLLIQGADARERRGPPSACPQPKVDCCETKPKCAPKPCKPAPCKPACNPDPCCPPVCFEKGFPTDPCCTPSAYSQSADIELAKCGWDVFITANFLYWDVQQDGMVLATPYVGTVSGATETGAVVSPLGAKMLVQDTDYNPGFQVGLGWSGPKDNWVLYAEYTWLHGSTATSANAPAPTVSSLNGTAVPPNGLWLASPWISGNSYNNFSTTIASTWKYKIDLLDAQVSRPFYSGARFVLEPFFGLRGSLIRQQLNIQLNNLSNLQGSPSPAAINGPSIVCHYNSRSVAIGPRAGLNGDWHLGYGFRMIGDAAASLLYTSFDARANAPSGAVATLPAILELDDYNCIRPNMDMSIGLGWGSYFGCRRFHCDFAATYDFNIFWGQNMMGVLAYETISPPAGDLFLQGLTIRTRIDF